MKPGKVLDSTVLCVAGCYSGDHVIMLPHYTVNKDELPSVQTFKRALKTELFRRSYDNAH